MGGSQGARAVNRAMLEALAALDASSTQLIWLTGRDDESDVRAAVVKSGFPAFVAAFHGRLDLAYRIADVCIARAGGSSLAELAHFGVATILIPLPTAAEDHQTRNAEGLANAGAAILLPQAQAAGGRLGALVRDLLDDDARRHTLARGIKAAEIPDAASRVVEAIEQTVSAKAQ